jgi:uncharacterized protein YndB with AHSA1/START domain
MTMPDTQAATSVHTATVVKAPVDRAFKVFTEEMASWWHPDHHLMQKDLKAMVVEPRAGGRIYDLATDGSECCWARVLAYEPPQRFVFSWDISPRWEIEPDHAKTSEVVVTFTAEDDETTRVELEHRHLDRHGEGWESERDAVGSPGGWSGGLGRFAEYVER